MGSKRVGVTISLRSDGASLRPRRRQGVLGDEVFLGGFGVHPDGEDARADDVVVATFPRRMPTAEVARRLRDAL